MTVFDPTVATFLIAGLFYAWKGQQQKFLEKRQRLHERVAWMLLASAEKA